MLGYQLFTHWRPVRPRIRSCGALPSSLTFAQNWPSVRPAGRRVSLASVHPLPEPQWPGAPSALQPARDSHCCRALEPNAETRGARGYGTVGRCKDGDHVRHLDKLTRGSRRRHGMRTTQSTTDFHGSHRAALAQSRKRVRYTSSGNGWRFLLCAADTSRRIHLPRTSALPKPRRKPADEHHLGA